MTTQELVLWNPAPVGAERGYRVAREHAEFKKAVKRRARAMAEAVKDVFESIARWGARVAQAFRCFVDGFRGARPALTAGARQRAAALLPGHEALHWFDVDGQVIAVRSAPRRRGWTARQFRADRRRYAREVKAARRGQLRAIWESAPLVRKACENRIQQTWVDLS